MSSSHQDDENLALLDEAHAKPKQESKWKSVIAFAAACALLVTSLALSANTEPRAVGSKPTALSRIMTSDLNDGFMCMGSAITAGKKMFSPDKNYNIVFQDDGNLVTYRSRDNRVMWASGTSARGGRFDFQDDGNVVIYDGDNRAKWASNTDAKGRRGLVLKLQNDANLVLYDSEGRAVFATSNRGGAVDGAATQTNDGYEMCAKEKYVRKLPVCLFLHGAMVKGARPTVFKENFGEISGAIRSYWGNFNLWYNDMCDSFLYGWAETENYAWTDDELQNSYADKAKEVIDKGGIVFAHSMANAILAGACHHKGKCVQWYSMGGGYSGQGVGDSILSIMGALPAIRYLVNDKVFQGFSVYNPDMRLDPIEENRNKMAKLVESKKLLKGSVCGVEPLGNSGLRTPENLDSVKGLLAGNLMDMTTFNTRAATLFKISADVLNFDQLNKAKDEIDQLIMGWVMNLVSDLVVHFLKVPAPAWNYMDDLAGGAIATSKKLGGGGGSRFDFSCGAGSFFDAFEGRTGAAMDAFGGICRGNLVQGMKGGGGGAYKKQVCGNGFSAVEYNHGAVVGSLRFKCHGDSEFSESIGNTNQDALISAAKGNKGIFVCPAGSVIRSMSIWAGGMTDAVQFSCGYKERPPATPAHYDLRTDGLVETNACAYWADDASKGEENGNRHWYGIGKPWPEYGHMDEHKKDDTHILARINHIEECGVFPERGSRIVLKWMRNMMCREMEAKGGKCPENENKVYQWPDATGQYGEPCDPTNFKADGSQFGIGKGCQGYDLNPLKEGNMCCEWGKLAGIPGTGKFMCQKKLKDWAGLYYCPSDCIGGSPGWLGGALNKPGSCEVQGRMHWPRWENEPCVFDTDCANFGWSGTGCCFGTCKQKRRDWAGVYWCP